MWVIAVRFYQCKFDRTFRNGGRKIHALTVDHKPENKSEKARIEKAGGKVYRSIIKIVNESKVEMMAEPYRVFPGKLSVSRTFGDAEAKLTKYGGIPNAIVALPDIISFQITDNHDFIVLGCDGIFDHLTNEEVVQCVWNSVEEESAPDVHKQCGLGVDCIIKNSLLRNAADNLTSIIVSFTNFKGTSKPNCKSGLSSNVNLHPEIISEQNNYSKTMKKPFINLFSGTSGNLSIFKCNQ